MYWLRYLIPAITFMVLLLTFKNYKFSLLRYYLLASLIVDIAVILLRRVFESEYYQIPAIFWMFAEFLFFMFYFYKNKTISRLWLTAIITTAIFTMGTFHLIRSGTFTIDGKIHAISLIPSLVLSIISYYKLLSANKFERITQSSFFWGNTAIFLYTSCALLTRFLESYFKKHDADTQKMVFLLFLFFVAVKTILIGVALSKKTIDAK